MSRYLRTFAVGLWTFLVLSVSCLPGQEAAPVPVNAESEASVREHLKRYVQAFNERQWESIDQLVSRSVTYRDESSGDQIASSQGLIDRIKAAVESEKDLALQARIDRMEFHDVGDDVDGKAVVHGVTKLTSAAMPAEASAFVVVLVKDAGQWTIVSIAEQPMTGGSETTGDQAIESLEWLLGTWEGMSDRQLRSEVEYLPGRKFIRRTIIDPATEGSLAYELIGFDAKLNVVRSWMFFSDGSFGGGVWSGGADHWSLKLTQTMSDGRTASGTYVIRPVDSDTMVVQMISREVEGEPMPSGAEITMKRIGQAIGDDR
ncbi:hypothetical protein [Rhodopirellula sp. MGV]|uniref:hypothetical protein n=1 Tax=Rhodopirellula sp. MGV TaxID=2023130 RepID=UPI000B9644AE|nr:hypothetical protein [Rhodopirellula sp. MGV]OYP30472.1 hypothetical protein CGZ80_22300 [Rhodopirellula sp. MGV]PNY33540.1 hypothetical protein C2E31_28055 [Rhodopirellula baltica]